MSDTTGVAAGASTRLSSEEIERSSAFAREPILLDGEGPEDLAPGSARRLAVDAAIAELDAGRETPSLEWRSNFSLILGLERLLDVERPRLADGTELSEHQVDALSGTLAALVTELEDPRSNGRANGAPAARVDAADGEVASDDNGASANGADG